MNLLADDCSSDAVLYCSKRGRHLSISAIAFWDSGRRRRVKRNGITIEARKIRVAHSFIATAEFESVVADLVKNVDWGQFGNFFKRVSAVVSEIFITLQIFTPLQEHRKETRRQFVCNSRDAFPCSAIGICEGELSCAQPASRETQ